MNKFIDKLYDRSIKGAIFCQVINIKPFIQFNPSITPGNQKWKGAAPILRRREELISMEINTLFTKKELPELNIRAAIITVKSRVAEASAWVKKYFSEASVERRLFVFVIKGIKDNKLISNPIHAPNHELAETEINVPLTKVMKNKNLVGLLSIREKRVKTSINGVWTQ